jgi:hypothetical protein
MRPTHLDCLNGLAKRPYDWGALFLGLVLLEEVGQFLFFNSSYSLAALTELFKCFDGGLRHFFVSFLGTSDQIKVFGSGDALVPIRIIETESQQNSAFICFVPHVD